MKRSISTLLVIAFTLAAIILMAGCGQTESGDDTPAEATSAEDEFRFFLVSHAPSTEQFWIPIDKGLQQAGEDMGVAVDYRGVQQNLSDPNEQRQLILNAIAAQPDGLIITNPNPESLNPAIKQAVDEGIPVVLINAGQSAVDEVGALTYVGNDEVESGRMAAQMLSESGCENALLVSLPQGALALTDFRNTGFVDGFPGTVTWAEIPLSNINDATRIRSIIETELQKNPAIDCVFSAGSAFTPAMLVARENLGERGDAIHWAAIDIVAQVVDALRNNEMDFALDQQQFSQGYLPVVILSMYLRFKVTPGSKAIGSGPGVVTPENVEDIVEVQEQGLR